MHAPEKLRETEMIELTSADYTVLSLFGAGLVLVIGKAVAFFVGRHRRAQMQRQILRVYGQ